MPQAETMTLHEKLTLGVEAIELKKQGKFEEAMRIEKSIPLPPYLAKWAKKRLGSDFLISRAITCPKRKLSMDLTGLLNSIVLSAANIDRGRKGFSTDGEEHQGRLNYESGIASASTAFTEAQGSADPQTMILAEEAFVEQELQFCSEQDTHTQSSLKAALQSFDDAFLSLEAVEDTAGYRVADKTWPHNPKNRIQGYPKDAADFQSDPSGVYRPRCPAS